MTTKTPSAETCASCPQPASDVTDQADGEGSRVTYNDGEGIKDRVVLSGPLSQVLEQQLHVIFKKQEFQTEEQSPSLESHATDVAVSAAFRAAIDQPDNQVILSNFDVSSIKDHIERVSKERPTNGDLENYSTIPVLVTDPDEVLNTPLVDVQLQSNDELILVAAPVVNNTQGKTNDRFLLRDNGNKIAQVLRTDRDTPELRMANDEPSLQDKVEAIERIYGKSFKHIHVGVEAFVMSLIERAKTK